MEKIRWDKLTNRGQAHGVGTCRSLIPNIFFDFFRSAELTRKL